jgi:NACHT domain
LRTRNLPVEVLCYIAYSTASSPGIIPPQNGDNAGFREAGMQDNVQRFAFFIVLFLLSFVAPTIVFLVSSDLWLRICAFAISMAALLFGFQLASDKSTSDNKVRLVVLSSLSSMFFSYLQFRQKLLGFLVPKVNVEIRETPLWDSTGVDPITLAIIVGTVVVAFLVLRSLKTPSALGRPESKIAEVLPPVTNLERLDNLKRTLRDQLDQIDHAARWNEANYVPLEAEVQILEGSTSRRRIVDLLTALRSDQRTRIFVVLGDPGTGKSVAMRKLARDLLMESGRSERIPVYINLKEWRPIRAWTLDSPPTSNEFYHFLYYKIMQSLEYNSQAFLRAGDTFKNLFEAGYFFFILDSFDEIPAVLDHEENSWLIEALSNCIVTCVLSGHKSRAVIASRLFRKPKIFHRNRSVYEIRPFSDSRIVKAIYSAANDPGRLMKIVLTERPDLGPIARNPFLLHLIISHFNIADSAPSSQKEMFETFFQSSIKLAREAYGVSDLRDEDIYEICEDIATIMFERPNIGLEINDVELQREITRIELPVVLRFLAQSRIGRLGGVSGAFSFSHRRFNEYFLVRRLAAGRAEVPYNAIQADSRWRDALVLYVEIAPEMEAKRIAKHAWRFASRLTDLSLGADRTAFVEARHAFRFIIESFRNRLDLLSDVQGELTQMVHAKLDSEADYIEKKTAIEALGLLPIQESCVLIIDVLQKYPGWISEQAAAAAKYIRTVETDLALALFDYCVNRPGMEGLIEAKRQEPIFAISNAFAIVARWLYWFRLDVFRAVFATITMISLMIAFNVEALLIILVIFVGAYFIAYIVIRFGSTGSMKYILATTSRAFGGSFGAASVVLVRRIDFFFAYVLAMMAFSCFVMVSQLLARMIIGEGGFSSGSIRYFGPVVLVLAVALFGLLPASPAKWKKIGKYWARNKGRRANVLYIFPLVLLVTMLAGRLPRIVGIAIIVFGAVCVSVSGLALIVPLLIEVKNLAIDLVVFRRVSRVFVPSRGIIACDFGRLRTSVFRNRFVDWVERASIDHVDTLRNLQNSWPQGRRPQIDGDAASIRLAQLDARWLDLD